MITVSNAVIPTEVQPLLRWLKNADQAAVRFCAKLLAFFILLATSVLSASAQDLPKGWRRPNRSEASADWRNKSSNRFLLVRGDFDGDGKSDVAELLINSSTKQFALFVKLATDSEWQLLDKPYAMDTFARIGINIVKPGRYETACGKGYGDWACAHGEPEWLKLAQPAIDYFYTESSDSIFYWNPKVKKFREVVMSD